LREVLLAFYTIGLTCPICGARMRSEPRRGRGARYIDPERYALEPSNMGLEMLELW